MNLAAILLTDIPALQVNPSSSKIAFRISATILVALLKSSSLPEFSGRYRPN